MRSRWGDAEARQFVARYPGVSEDLALRVYSSRLIGQEPDLVLHGGGNTSLKARARDLYGEEIEVMHIKGSGWDLASIEPAGLPAVRLEELRRLRGLAALPDERMVAELRRALLDSSAPNPSVEALLHAFLPHRYLDHSHADALLALTNQPDAEARVRRLYGDRVAFVPYEMPGFALAKRACEIFEKHPEVEGLVLEKHGLFSFGEDAHQSYSRHIDLVDLAERHIREGLEGTRPLDARPVVALREPHEVAPLVRGALAEPGRRFVLEHRSSDELLHFAAAELGRSLSEAPPITPDHAIRTKGVYLFLERPPYGDLDALGERLRSEVGLYRQRYREYFDRNVRAKNAVRTMLDPTPRVVVLPGLGIFAAGESRKAARIAADIAEHNIKTKIWAATIGHYQGIDEGDLFDMEYWSLEQAKLRSEPAPLAGQVALVTGAAGAIGEAIAELLLEVGAQVVLLDVDCERLQLAHERLDSEGCEMLRCDVGDEDSVEQGFAFACSQFGGVDLVVANAGIARAGTLDELEREEFERAVDVNLNGTFLTLRHALRLLKRQGTGGSIVIVSTKNVFAPGAGFGAYSASKAGAHQLGKIAALEGAESGIRVNMINADAVFGEPHNPSGLWAEVGPSRARARGLDPAELPEYYRQRNLLKAEVTARHVANAVLFFASEQTPTTGAALPVDGGLPDAFPR